MSAATAARSLRWVREWWMSIAVVVLTAGIVVLFVLLVPALGRISEQAEAGREAKARSCTIFPVSAKLFTWAHDHGVITDVDLAIFFTSRLGNCPPPPVVRAAPPRP